MVERGGRIKLRVIADSSRRAPEWSSAGARQPERDHLHRRLAALPAAAAGVPKARVINHSAGVYVEGDVHTNTIEGFFGNLKTGMRGAYKQVSRWLQSYLDEYAWRYNRRHQPGAMFFAMLDNAARAGR